LHAASSMVALNSAMDLLNIVFLLIDAFRLPESGG